jgi:hypothetical protein
MKIQPGGHPDFLNRCAIAEIINKLPLIPILNGKSMLILMQKYKMKTRKRR